MLLAPCAVSAENNFELHVTNDLSFSQNWISGPGSDNSALNEGGHFLEVLSVDGYGNFSDLNYDFHLGGMLTDDENNDINRYSLTNFAINAATPNQAFSLGDTFQTFSQYTLTTALKGAGYRYTGNENPLVPRVSVTYGLAAPRWDSIWSDPDTVTMKRQVYGTRIELGNPREFTVGFNIVGLSDSEPIETYERVYEGTIYSLDLNYVPIKNLTLLGEAAFNNEKVGTGTDEDLPEKLNGYAVKLRAVGDQDPSRVTIEYERVDPEFENPVGSATPDREKIKFMWRYKITRNVHWHTNMLWFHDDLDGASDVDRTDNYRPELAMSWQRPFNRRYGYAKLSYTKKIAVRDGDEVRNDDVVYLNYRDRFSIIDMDTNLGYSLYKNEGDTELDTNEFLYNTVLRSRITAGLFVIKPAVFLGGWNFNDDLQNTSDQFYEYAVGLGIDVPKAKITSDFRIGVNELDKENGTDTEKTFNSLNIFWRPGFLSSFNNGVIFLRSYLNDFDFSSDGDDFKEESITAGISISI